MNNHAKLGRQRITNNGTHAVWSVPNHHNRVEVVAVPNSSLSAGDVLLYRHEAVEGAKSLHGLAGSIPFDARGGVVVLSVPLGGAQLSCASDDLQIIGTADGAIDVVCRSWREG
jgi:hypothetical protein